MKALFVGDVHLKATNPVARKDNYAQAILDKLSWIATYAKTNDVSKIYFTGDIFDALNIPIPYLALVIETFQSICSGGLEVFTIAGNHDLKYDAMRTLPFTPLGILMASGAIKLLTTDCLGTVLVKGISYNEPWESHEDAITAILVGHQFYGEGFDGNGLTDEMCKQLKYTYYVLGHDHAPYQDVNKGDYSVIRMGSLSRNSSDTFNLTRKPRVWLFDSKTEQGHFIEVPCDSAEDVFSQQEAEKVTMSMSELVDYMQTANNSTSSNVRDFVSSCSIADDVRSLIITYMNTLGV